MRLPFTWRFFQPGLVVFRGGSPFTASTKKNAGSELRRLPLFNPRSRCPPLWPPEPLEPHQRPPTTSDAPRGHRVALFGDPKRALAPEGKTIPWASAKEVFGTWRSFGGHRFLLQHVFSNCIFVLRVSVFVSCFASKEKTTKATRFFTHGSFVLRVSFCVFCPQRKFIPKPSVF